MKRISIFCLAILCSVTAAFAKPNVIFILCDDLGYGDVGCYNSDSGIPTPHLDKLAAEGMRFTDAHSGSAVCTPTRYGVITGRYSWRSKMKRGVLNGYSPALIDPERLTVGDLMQEKGYHTACVGKWHLGWDWEITGPGEGRNPEVDWSKPIKNGPTHRGFNTYFGVSASLDMPPYCWVAGTKATMAPTIPEPATPFPTYWREGPRSEDLVFDEVLDVLAKRCSGYIRTKAKQETPFFLYVPLPAPHKPIVESEKFKGKTPFGPYGDFIVEVDHTIGRIVKAVDQAGVAEDTLIMVTSDNGSYMYLLPEGEPDHVDDTGIQGYHRRNSNAPLRGTKADVWEGGHRVPFIARWPKVVEAGSECDETICHVDLMATCAEIVGTKLPAHAGEDSFSILPLLTNGKWGARKRAPVVNHSGGGMFAIRDGKWKLVLGSGSGGRQDPRGKRWEQPYHLFDLDADLGETTNLIDRYPEQAQRMETMMMELFAEGKSR
jgi:arylsulfatase A-like enzyme